MKAWKTYILSGCIFLSLLASSGTQATSLSDNELFRHEYEIMNGQTTLDGAHTYQALDIPEDISIVYLESDELNSFLDDGSGVLYLGFPECPWCRTLLPVLFEAIKNTDFDGSVFYYNAQPDRNSLSLDENGNVIVEKEGTALYDKLLQKLDSWLEPYSGLNDPSIKRILFPTTVFIQDGEVRDVHCVTVSGQTDGYAPLTDAQYDELLKSLTKSINLIFLAL